MCRIKKNKLLLVLFVLKKGGQMTQKSRMTNIEFDLPANLELELKELLEGIRERLETARSEFKETMEEVMSDEWEGNGLEKWLFGDSAEYDRRREWQKTRKYAIFAM